MICTWCKEDKPEEAFAIKSKATGRRLEYCRKCKSHYNKTWYSNNKSKHIEVTSRNRKEYFKRSREIIDRLKDKPCADCGERYPPYVMDFDHLDSKEKEFQVSLMRYHSEAKILAEVAKCEVVCANCHRERTHVRRTAVV